MSRRYMRLTIEMIAEVPTADATFIQRIKQGVAGTLNDSPLDAGEVNVRAEIFGEVVVNANGFAVPWIEPVKTHYETISCDICGKPVYVEMIYIIHDEQTVCKDCYDRETRK